MHWSDSSRPYKIGIFNANVFLLCFVCVFLGVFAKLHIAWPTMFAIIIINSIAKKRGLMLRDFIPLVFNRLIGKNRLPRRYEDKR